MDSPLAIEEKVNPVVSHTEPPSLQNAAPKLTRVRVLASKNRLPNTAPSSTRDTFWRRAMGCIWSAIRKNSSTDSRVNWSTDSNWCLPSAAIRLRSGPVCALCAYFCSKPSFSTISVTKRFTTSGMALNSCEPSGKSQVSRARRFTPMRPAKISRVRFRRRIASRRNTCCETDLGTILIYIRKAYILFMFTTVDEHFLWQPTKYNRSRDCKSGQHRVRNNRLDAWRTKKMAPARCHFLMQQ